MNLKIREKDILKGVRSPLYFKSVLGVYIILLLILLVIGFALVVLLGKLYGLVGGIFGIIFMAGSYFLCTYLSKKFGDNGHHLLLISLKRKDLLRASKQNITTGKIL